MVEIAAIILAAGRSSRFDAGPQETKLAVPLFGKPLVRHAAEAALASRARPILIVTGHAAPKVEAALADLPTIGGRGSGAEDAIAADETGLLVDGTSGDAVAEAILALLEDPARAARMGIHGRERALANFTWRGTAAKIASAMVRGNGI